MAIFIKRFISIILLWLLFNLVWLAGIQTPIPLGLFVLAGIALLVYFVYFNIAPSANKTKRTRLTKRALADGCELILSAAVCFTLEVSFYIACAVLPSPEISPLLWGFNIAASLLGIFVLIFNGIIRIFLSSGQLGLLPRLLLLFFWWVPVINLLLLRHFFRAANSEYRFVSNRDQRNVRRAEDAVCKTKYPLLLIHGIFFRDWKYHNYWGRIPEELIKNGAVIYYGGQQSSATVEQNAVEIKEAIQRILLETGCEKVNIIAHSKGGLDARYAVSQLGMAPYIASLTTINTPHYGCNYVGRLLEMIPTKAVKNIGKKYNTLYTVLGDNDPDFFKGLCNLTDTACAALNERMPDKEGVLYQSVASKIKYASGAMFPLNIGYRLVKQYEGDNDGLVSVDSMIWGEFLGVITPAGQKGITHGDVIDLTRKNIPGFDVCEYYVDLVSRLKARGM